MGVREVRYLEAFLGARVKYFTTINSGRISLADISKHNLFHSLTRYPTPRVVYKVMNYCNSRAGLRRYPARGKLLYI